ncbi:hypothetical protein ACR2XN_29230, partial [Klebsiella pneumoniae]
MMLIDQQLVDYDSDSSDESNRERELRTPIALPTTSLRMAEVISFAGTAGAETSKGLSETHTERMSETLTQGPSETLKTSETPAELANTLTNIPPNDLILSLQNENQRLNAKVGELQDRSCSSRIK